MGKFYASLKWQNHLPTTWVAPNPQRYHNCLPIFPQLPVLYLQRYMVYMLYSDFFVIFDALFLHLVFCIDNFLMWFNTYNVFVRDGEMNMFNQSIRRYITYSSILSPFHFPEWIKCVFPFRSQKVVKHTTLLVVIRSECSSWIWGGIV